MCVWHQFWPRIILHFLITDNSIDITNEVSYSAFQLLFFSSLFYLLAGVSDVKCGFERGEGGGEREREKKRKEKKKRKGDVVNCAQDKKLIIVLCQLCFLIYEPLYFAYRWH